MKSNNDDKRITIQIIQTVYQDQKLRKKVMSNFVS